MGLSESFPAPGNAYEVRLGDVAFRLDFDPNGQQLTFSPIGADQGDLEGHQTVRYTAVPIRPGVFLVYWQESGGTTVTHVEDFERGLVHSNITSPTGEFLNLSGTLTAV